MAVRVTRAGVGLTVGIIVLALVVLGGLYLAKNRGEQARREDAIEVAQQNLESQSGTGTITPSIDGNVDESGTSRDDAATNEEANGSSGGINIDTNNSDDVAVNDPQNGTETLGTQDSPSELPQTGSAEIVSLITSAMLTFAAVSYVASRRNLAQK